jgi:DHA2 family multidrug resistance protein
VFSAVFLLFPVRLEGPATTIAGVLAVLAPTVGPIVGGWITQTYSWRWLFLINVLPGLVAAASAAIYLQRTPMQLGLFRTLDLVALLAAALALTALEIGLKDAPGLGWLSLRVLCLFAVSAAGAVVFVVRSLLRPDPIVELRTFRDRNFTLGCMLSFALGAGLFGSVYLMPVFLAFVRGHDALAIGQIMLVSGAAQLAMAPVAVLLERRVDARLLASLGFLVFSIGLGLSAFQSTATDFSAMVLPQLVRGAAIMFCLLPPTRLALGGLAAAEVPDASGLFNLMRNLGGAIGLALIDTVIYGRTPGHVATIVSRLQAGNLDTARAVGIPLALFRQNVGRAPDPRTLAMLRPLVQRLALTQAINEAWAMLAVFSAAALAAVLFAARDKPAAGDLPGPAEGLATA